jgi:drug/metabolite transporter (DMT)-like permease
MNALDKLSVLCLVLAAVLLALACIKADRVRAWRERFNPAAEEVPDSAFTVTRVMFVLLAGMLIYMAIQGFDVAADQP